MQRLDSLQVGLWDRAVSGDAKAVNAVLRIIDQRSRLRGLYKSEAAPSGSRSLVGPASWEWLRQTQG